jgi:hypothetical protein
MKATIWFELDEGGVLEIDDPPLELHLREMGDSRTIWWWENEEGAFLGEAAVGET